MSRPEHLNVPNTPEGIRAINQRQEAYDRDPAGYEQEQARYKEEREQEQMREHEEREKWEAEQAGQEQSL